MGFSKETNNETNRDADDIFAVLDDNEAPLLKPIIDSGASKSIIGIGALNTTLKSCTKQPKTWIMTERSIDYKPNFRFGKGDQVAATHVIHLPVRWKDERFKLKLHVIDDNVPFLIGIEAISKMGLILDLKSMRLTIGDKSESIKQSDSGHIIWDSLMIDIEAANREMDVFMVKECGDEQNYKRLHVKLGHASAEKLETLIKHSTILGKPKGWKEKVRRIVADCNICEENTHQTRRNKVTGMRSKKFNDSVAIDLAEWYGPGSESKLIICHMIDEFSRLSGGGVVKSKEPKEIIECVLIHWISKYGCPTKILHDNGGELVNDLFLKMTDVLNIRSVATPSYSPFCNGVVERVVKRTMTRMRHDNATSYLISEAIFNYAVMAKNSLMNKNGYSPHQIVFGHSIYCDNFELGNPSAVIITADEFPSSKFTVSQ